MTVIDLGETRGRTTDVPPPETPAGRGRDVVLAVLAGLALLFTGAAAPAAMPFVRLGSIHAAAGDPMYVVGSTAYVAKIHDTPTAVEAYDVRTGSRRWSAPYEFDPVSGYDVQLELADGRLTVQGDAFDGATVVAYDAATGRLRWRVGIEYLALDDGRMLVGDELRTTLSLMDPASGATLWSIPFTGCGVDAYDERDTVAVQCDGGRRLRLVDVRTGAVKATRDLSAMRLPDPGIPEEQRTYQVALAGNNVIVGIGSNGFGWIEALRPTDLSTVWAKSIALFGEAYIYECDRSLCVVDPPGRQRFDPATGARLGDLSDDGPVTDDTHALDVLGGDGHTRPPAIVLDPRPRVPATLASGRDTLMDMYDGQNRAPYFAGAYPTWVLRADPDPHADYGYRFAIVGKLDGVLATACFTTRRYLACATATDTVTFFDLPPEDRPR